MERIIYIERLGGCVTVIDMSKAEFYANKNLRYICTMDSRFDDSFWYDDAYNVYEDKTDGKLYGIWDCEV